jgi:hypothetical protein
MMAGSTDTSNATEPSAPKPKDSDDMNEVKCCRLLPALAVQRYGARHPKPVALARNAIKRRRKRNIGEISGKVLTGKLAVLS